MGVKSAKENLYINRSWKRGESTNYEGGPGPGVRKNPFAPDGTLPKIVGFLKRFYGGAIRGSSSGRCVGRRGTGKRGRDRPESSWSNRGLTVKGWG